MNIQPFGSPAAPKLDDRPVGTAEPHTTTGTASVKSAATQADPSSKASPSRAEVDAAVKKLNDAMPGASQTLQFSVDHDSKEIVVKLIDQNTKEVLRQIPSVEALQIAKSIDASLDKKQGLLIDHSA